MDKLNLDNFPEKERQYILHLKDVMTSQDPARIAEHVELAKTAPSGPGDSEHLEAPATFTLLMYGISGLGALYEIAIQDVLSSGIWDAKEAILSVALRRSSFPLAQIALSQTYLDDGVYKRIAEKVKTTCEDPAAVSLAQQLLAKVLQVLLSNPNRHSELGHLIFLESDMIGRAATISTASSLVIELIARNSLALSDEICDAFQKLINDDLDESVYQSFLESHPTLLDPLASSIVERQHLAEMWRTDFVIRRLDNEYRFVEIEKPRDQLFTNYPSPAQSLSHALGQVLNWFIWVEDNIAYAQSHGFPGVHMPNGIVVIGRNRDLSPTQLRMLKALNDALYPRIVVYTYDDVLQNARNVLRNLTNS